MSDSTSAPSAALSSGELGAKPATPRGGASGGFTEMPGTLTGKMGTGDNAKNSIVWMVITWSFSIASALSLLFFSLVVCYKDFDYMENIKSVWSIFVPLITLALGYAFGRSK